MNDRPLSAMRLNELWAGGYCRRAIERCRLLLDDNARAQFMREHVPDCELCRFANMLKQIEARAATLLGPDAARLQRAGGNVAALPGFKLALLTVVRETRKAHGLPQGLEQFMRRVQESRSGPYPGPGESESN